MLIRIKPDAPVPLYAQIAAAVRRGVAVGEIQPGERLPAARDLAVRLDINVNTVLHGYRELRDEGLVELRRGRGAAVRRDAVPGAAALRAAVAALVIEARRAGLGADETALLVQKGMA